MRGDWPLRGFPRSAMGKFHGGELFILRIPMSPIAAIKFWADDSEPPSLWG
jgi:hypothetical protein